MSRAVIVTVTGLVAAIAATALAWSAAAALKQEEPEVRRGQSVTICHATGNGKYVQNSPDVDSIVSGQGHGGHPEDIVPPFDYPPSGQDPGGHYDGKNWDDEGQAIWDNGCVAPDPPDPPDPPDCNQASVSATKDEYTYPEVVEMTGAGFPADKSGEFRVVHSGGSVVSDGSVASSSSGSFGPVQVWDGANAFPGDNEYRIEVTGPSCTKSDTFSYRMIENPPAPLVLDVKKVVVGSDRSPSEFSFTIGNKTAQFDADGSNRVTLPAGTYTVTEPPVVGFTTTYSDCTDIESRTPTDRARLHDHEHRRRATAAAPPGAQGRGRLHEASE